jgi:uncharacterized protein (TIGR01244 family)
MRYAAIQLVSLALAGVIAASTVIVYADGTPEKPNAPRNIDATPPLVPIPNARVTTTGLLIGGQPSVGQLKAIQQAGYQMVISLRPESEHGDEGEAAAVEQMGMKFVRIPVAGAAGLTESNARALDAALVQRDVLPAVVHCSIGQRVSALLGLRAFVVDRVSPVAAMDLARSLGLKQLEAALRERIDRICKADPSRNCMGLQ